LGVADNRGRVPAADEIYSRAAVGAFFAYVVIDSSIIHPHKEPILDYVLVYGIFIYLGVNFIYLVRRQRK
jgi:hypothetical protein